MARSKEAFRVGISGSYGGLNLGDEAILSGIVKELRRSLPLDSFMRIRNRHDPGSSPELPVLDGFDRVDQHDDVQGQIVPDHIPDPSFQGDSESNGCPGRQASGQHEPQRGGKHIHF